MAETTEGAVVKQINEIRQCSGRFLRLTVGLLVVVKVNRAIEHRLHLGLHRGTGTSTSTQIARVSHSSTPKNYSTCDEKKRVADLRFYGLIDRLDTSLTDQCPILCFSPHTSII